MSPQGSAPVSFESGGFRATFTNLGEGISGDYDPEDENDVRLLRIDLEEMVDGDYQQIPCGSYCTSTPVDTTPEEQTRLLGLAVGALIQAREQKRGLKRVGEMLSWIKPAWKSARLTLNGLVTHEG